MPTCYHCKSSQVKKISAIILQGTTNIELGHGVVGIGASKRGLGIGGAKGRTGGKIKSALVTKLEKKKPTDPFIFLGFAIAFILPAYLLYPESGLWNKDEGNLGVLIVFGLIIICLAAFWQSKKTYPNELNEFNNTWYCYTCGSYSLTKSKKKIFSSKKK
tara:strand:+ start:280 stop:759 length:480 start_codon:yes stop_codon:yes gene_type:complete